MRLGIDFDNTIISYDEVFQKAATQRGIDISTIAPNKTALRDHIRSLPNGEITWQKIQAEVYGPKIAEAHPFEGFDHFIKHCRSSNIQIFIVSHKTKFAAQNPHVDLRAHARTWMKDHGFFNTLGFEPAHIFFENTRQEKIKRLIKLGCTHIIDDLIEVLTDPQIPQNIQKIWFSQNPNTSRPTNITQCQTWASILRHLQ